MTDQSQQDQNSSPATTSGGMPCPLLQLSAELRNKMWELAFTVNDKSTRVDLFKAVGPSCALLLTCKKISSEATGIFKTAQHHYWEETKFKIVGNYAQGGTNNNDQIAQILGLKCRGVALIKNLKLHLSFPHNDIQCKVVAGTKNLAWKVMLSGDETDTLGSCILDQARTHVDYDDCEMEGPTVEEILQLLRRIPSARRDRTARWPQKKKFARVWQFMIGEAERIAENFASFGFDLWKHDY
ncbi:hypothetical protein TI39_contig390g00010 [Zymoseptoria brevis]|uniref:Uncharacterized protein n=1 Tax=Zymoseptoria brevis TaxID=1047168 RepID=A0A0F4GMZ3_9PEZI|nr:hypothetical protein TI39_contig390g00010 [Zymoseptoria brevis]